MVEHSTSFRPSSGFAALVFGDRVSRSLLERPPPPWPPAGAVEPSFTFLQFMEGEVPGTIRPRSPTVTLARKKAVSLGKNFVHTNPRTLGTRSVEVPQKKLFFFPENLVCEFSLCGEFTV